MKVEELISLLKSQDPEAEVIIKSDNFELRNSLVNLSGVNKYSAVKRKERFRDAFDGTAYSAETWSLFPRGEEKESSQNVVLIY